MYNAVNLLTQYYYYITFYEKNKWDNGIGRQNHHPRKAIAVLQIMTLRHRRHLQALTLTCLSISWCCIQVTGFVAPQRTLGRRLSNAFQLASGAATLEYDDFLPYPNPSHESLDVVRFCMETLMTKGNNEGLEVCFNFSSDYLQAPFQGSLEKFSEHANNPIFGSLVKCTKYTIVSAGPLIPGTTTRGAMQTFLMDVESPGSEDRRYLWTLQKERRPPRSDCWLVHEVLFVKNAFQLTL